MAKDNTQNIKEYKPSPIGMIPKDWDALRIKDFTSINNSTINESNSKDSSFFYIDLSSVKQGKITFPKNKIKFSESPSRARRKLKRNNVIIATVRPNLLGFAVANFPTEDFICSTGFALIEAEDLNESQFIYQNLYSKSTTDQIENLVVGSSYPAINNSDVENLIFPYPKNKKEREKIAQILTTWDEAIETLDTLIQRKERHKKALMQQLLTGKKRFKEFKGEKWKDRLLGEVVKFSNGKAHENLVVVDGKYVLVTSKFVSTNGKEFRSVSECHSPLLKDDVVMVMSDIPNGQTLAKCFLIDQNDKYALNQRVGLFRANQNIHPSFLYYSINRDQYFLDFDSGVGQTNLRKDDILNCPIKLPSYKEQEKIVSILSYADEEIQTLKIQLEHSKNQKKGLMQVLLTGKIRVKI